MTAEIRQKFRDLNVGVLIPTYNNATSFEGVLCHVLEFTDRVLIVIDGSTDDTATIISRFPTVDLITYPKNVGKGWALRKGFEHALEKGFDYVITLDSDGQHNPSDLPVFLSEIELFPDTIIMGARNMEQASVPGKSSFGNKFSNFWFWFETGIRLPDTQTGFRCYPIRAMEGMKFFTRKFEFEIEVIVRSVWKGIGITFVPVNVYYPPKEERVSHFRPFKDFTRISILNTVLVTMALLYYKPRDFFRSIKKKTFDKSFATYSQTQRSLTQ
jgi:glycosyltransferase involved in cell wall biosynthesis